MVSDSIRRSDPLSLTFQTDRVINTQKETIKLFKWFPEIYQLGLLEISQAHKFFVMEMSSLVRDRFMNKLMYCMHWCIRFDFLQTEMVDG